MHSSNFLSIKKLTSYFFSILFLASCNKGKQTTTSPVKFIDLAPNGAWVWHTDPVTIWHQDRLFFAYVDSEGNRRIMISSYDPETDKIFPIEVSTKTSYATDSHDHPAFSVLPDDNLYITYNRHSKDKGFFHRRSKIATPEKTNDFTEESLYKVDSVKTITTYNNIYYLTSEKRMHYFGRWLNRKPTWTTSNDTGQTWSAPQQVLENEPGRPYVHYASNLKDRIDMIYTDGHPRVKNNSIYHLFYKNDSFFNSSGKHLSMRNTLPIKHDINGGTVVYEYTNKEWTDHNNIHDWIPNGIAWVWDLEYNKSGEPVCVFSVRLSENKKANWESSRIFYYYAWWKKGIGWQKRCIAQGGNALYEKEIDFAGGLCLNPDDPTEVFLSTNSATPFDLSTLKAPLFGQNEYKIYRGKFNLDSKEFKGELFYEKEGQLAIRPLMPKGNKAYKALLWMEGNEYVDFSKYQTGLKAAIIKQK